jgi:hypothetical protein
MMAVVENDGAQIGHLLFHVWSFVEK